MIQEGMDIFHELGKDIKTKRHPGQSKVSYYAQKAIPLVTGAIGEVIGSEFGGVQGAALGTDLGVKAGNFIGDEAEKRREKLHPLQATSTMSTRPSKPLPPPLHGGVITQPPPPGNTTVPVESPSNNHTFGALNLTLSVPQATYANGAPVPKHKGGGAQVGPDTIIHPKRRGKRHQVHPHKKPKK